TSSRDPALSRLTQPCELSLDHLASWSAVQVAHSLHLRSRAMMYAPIKPRVAALVLLFGVAVDCASFGDLRAQPARMQIATRGPARAVWTKERARAWADSTGWLVGSNFIPSTAINQLEMWQAATFDPRTIDR